MKEIKAYIKSHKLSDVTLALHKVEGLTGMSIVEVQGFGRSKVMKAFKSQNNDPADYVPYVKIEVVCHDHLVNEILSIIKKTAYTGLRGDGKIYVTNVETAVRIESGEVGEEAV